MGIYEIYLITMAATWDDNDIPHRELNRFIVPVQEGDQQGNELMMEAALRKVRAKLKAEDDLMKAENAIPHDKWTGWDFVSIELMEDAKIL